jgi:hypothetical protein
MEKETVCWVAGLELNNKKKLFSIVNGIIYNKISFDLTTHIP